MKLPYVLSELLKSAKPRAEVLSVKTREYPSYSKFLPLIDSPLRRDKELGNNAEV